jgi:hypothetical protein
VLDIVFHHNIRLSHVNVSDILESDYLPIIFHILEHVTTNKPLEPLEIFTNRERFQSLASNLISPGKEINSVLVADKSAREFTASNFSEYRLSTSRAKFSHRNHDHPGLDRLLKHKRRLRKLWQEIRDPECEKAFNRISRIITRDTRKRALRRWGTKVANFEVIPQAIWPVAKYLMNRDGPRTPTVIHCLLSPNFLPLEKPNATAWKSSSQYSLGDVMNGRWRLEPVF